MAQALISTNIPCHSEGALFATDTCTAVRMQCGESLL
jgi:hypothetical protein